MKNADTAYVTVGKIGSTYGVKGWLKIQSYTEQHAQILEYAPWYVADNTMRKWGIIDIEESRAHGDGIIVKFKGINNPEDARLLTGKLIGVSRSQLPPLPNNEYYWSDLKGLTVLNKQGEVLGTVIYLMTTGSNDVLVIKNTKEHAIPYLPGTVILGVDLQKKEIYADWELI